MSEILCTVLEKDELVQIPENLLEKLDKELQIKASLIDTLQSEVERVRADYEQKCYEVEKRMIEMSIRLDNESSNSAKAAKQCQQLEQDVQVMREKGSALEMCFAEAQGEIAALKHTRDLWKDEKLSMQHLIERKDLEVNKLKTEWKEISDKLTIAISSKNNAELKLDEIQNSGVTAEYHNKRLERENDLLKQQNQQLSDELASKSTELNAVKVGKENELVSLRGRLEIKMDDCKQATTTSERLRAANDELEKKVNSLLHKVSSAEEDHRSLEELYRNELQSQEKLVELYKSSAKDEEEKCSQLASAVQELQKLVTTAEEANKQLLVEMKGSDNKSVELTKEVEILKKELEKANDLLTASKGHELPKLSEEDLTELCPAAAMASKFIKSGMTLTEIYTKYVEVVDEAEVLKQENKRLNEAMDEILEELNEKAPILKQQREDYEHALATITQLTSQMDAAAVECQHLRAQSDDSLRKMGRVERENKRLQMETKDLSTQVQYLLKQFEESHGQKIKMIPEKTHEDDSNVTSSSEVISHQLVTFKNIEELQQQNQKLLQVIRELSDEKENEEQKNQDRENKKLKQSLEEANEELESLRQDRDRQIEFVEAIVRQRDMYRVLLSQASSSVPSVFTSPHKVKSSSPGNASGDASSGNGSIQDLGEQASNALKILKNEYDEFKKEVQENNKVMNEQTETLRSKIAEINADNAQLQAKVDFSAEKYNIIKQSFDNSCKESEMLREKNSKLLLLVQKHEITLSNLTTEISRLQQEKTKILTKLDASNTEMDILKRAEDRLQSENSSLKRDQHGQSVLLTNLQKIQQTMEKQEFEVRSQLRSRLEAQEEELKTMRRTTNESLQQKQVSLQVAEKQLLATQQNLEKQQTLHDTVSKELKSVKEELETTRLEKQNVEAKLASLEQRLSRLAGQKPGDVSNMDDEDAENLKSVMAKHASLLEEVDFLKLKLDKGTRAVQQHKDVATAAEESLKQANAANKELSQTLEARLKNASEQQTKLEQTITKLEDENRQLNSKKTSLINEVDFRTADLNKQLVSLKNELDLCIAREKESRKNEQEARKELADQTDVLHEAQTKYQREMILHAESVKELLELKEKVTKQNLNLENALVDAQQAKHLLDSNKGIWEKQKIKLMEENTEMKQRNEELNGQFTLLHSQMETMSNQMLTIKQKQSPPPVAPFGKHFSRPKGRAAHAIDTDDTKDKSDEQLMDIIKFLRKEKNLYEMKFEVTQSESSRLKQQMAYIQKQFDDVKKKLQEEQQKSQASSSELAKHESLMKKVETLNVLSDSNRMLRDEKDRLQETLQTIRMELDELKAKMSPLKTENNQLLTQIATLKSEKIMLEQDVQRWQQRSQQLIQSPRRQDPEEYRRLMNEKQKLSRTIEQVNKEVTEKKLEISDLHGQIRNLNQQVETHKNENSSLLKKVEAAQADTKSKQAELEEKNKTMMQIRRVGRRYKAQFEELQKKQQILVNQKLAEETKQQEPSPASASDIESNARLAALEESLSKVTKEKEELTKKLELSTDEVESLKTQLQKSNEKTSEEDKVGSGKIVEENDKLISERDEMRKQLLEKEEKSKRLLTLAKNRIGQIQKEKDEMAAERDRLRSEEVKMKEEMERLKKNVKDETEQKLELQNKVDDLQRQLTTVSTQQQQQNKITSVVGHQIHHHAGSSGSLEMRKAANIRPISTQRVSQVSPMRVTRTARVMPEPQQEAQEGISSENVSARTSPHAPVAPSSTHIASSINVNAMPTRAFVHPINPTSGRQQLVVSSMPTSSALHQMSSRPESISVEPSSARNSSSASDSHTQDSFVSVIASSSINITNLDAAESDQAIVSSSDDQPMSHEDGQHQTNTSSGNAGAQTSGPVVSESEAPSQSSASSSADVTGILSGIPLHMRQSHKRSYDDSDENTAGEETPASSSDANVASTPISKRQRSSPDQSSAASHPTQTQACSSHHFGDSATRVEQAESSNLQSHEKPIVYESEHESKDQIDEETEDCIDTSTFVPIPDAEANSTVVGQSLPSSSVAEEVIVLSSGESEDEPSNLNTEEGQDEIYNDEDSNGMIVQSEEPEGGEIILQDLVEQAPQSSTRPLLVLQPTPPDSVPRSRVPIRPAPLTPGLAPPATDDGDGIVPCTPTLPTRRHDDNYQTINSPHVPPGGPAIRFRFEDSFQSQGGIGSVDNTLMDFSAAGEEASRSITAIAVPVSSTNTISDERQMPSSEISAVSSSIAEDDLGQEGKETESELCVPISSSVADDQTRESNDSRETGSNLQNIRGRRIRLIGARSRGKGGSSPSTSSQQ